MSKYKADITTGEPDKLGAESIKTYVISEGTVLVAVLRSGSYNDLTIFQACHFSLTKGKLIKAMRGSNFSITGGRLAPTENHIFHIDTIRYPTEEELELYNKSNVI